VTGNMMALMEPVHQPAAAAAARVTVYRRRRPRLGLLRRAVLTAAAAWTLSALSDRAAVCTAQCTGGGIPDDVLCQALGHECGEVAGAQSADLADRPLSLTRCAATARRRPACTFLTSWFLSTRRPHRYLRHDNHLPSLRRQHGLHRPFLLLQMAHV
jgi:hypothetical protein